MEVIKNEFGIPIGHLHGYDEELQGSTIIDIFRSVGGIDGIIGALGISKIDPETGFDILKVKAEREINQYFEFFKACIWDVQSTGYSYSTGKSLDAYFMSQDRSNREIIKQSFACRLFLFLTEMYEKGQYRVHNLSSYIASAMGIREKMRELQDCYEREGACLKDLEFPIKELRKHKKYWKLCDKIQLIEQLGDIGVLTVRDLISLTERQLNNKFRKKKLTSEEKVDLKDGFHEIQYNLHRMGLRLKTKVE